MTTTNDLLFVNDVANLANALRVSLTLLSVVDNKRLGEISKTLSTADTMAMFLVAPIHFKQATQNVEMQQRLVQWAEDTRQCLRDILKTKDESELFKGWEDGETPSLAWLLGENEHGD